MRDSFRVKLIGVVAVSALGLPEVRGAQEPVQSAPTVLSADTVFTPASPTVALEFAGTWDYNALESINILTGRVEQAPRSATQGGGRGSASLPRGSAGGAGAGGSRGTGTFAGPEFGPSRPPSSGGLGLGPTPEMMREQRDMSRDLLEVPEQYTIALAEGTITFVDDLERERTYLVGGRKQKYRLGASEFNARVEWNGTQLRKEIEGSLGFRMAETYFLSPDARRMFVIVRVGQQNRNRQPSGFNRVYDRVDTTAPAEAVASR